MMVVQTTAPATRRALFLERWAIIAGFAFVVLASRAGPILFVRTLGAPTPDSFLADAIRMTALWMLPLPIVIGMLQRHNGLRAEIGSAFVYLAIITFVNGFEVFLMRPDADLAVFATLLPFTLPTPMILFFAVLGVVRALQWSRDALAIEMERRQLESQEIHRIRREVERRSRPAIIGETLARIETLLPTAVEEADRLVRRLARYARGLLATEPSLASTIRVVRVGLDLRRVPTQIEVVGPADSIRRDAEEIAAAIEAAAATARPPSVLVSVVGEQVSIVSTAEFDEALRTARAPAPVAACASVLRGDPPRPLFGVLLAMVILCGVFATVNDLRTATRAPFVPVVRTLGLCLYIVAGPLLATLAVRAARLPIRRGVAMVSVEAFLVAGAVSMLAVSIGIRLVGQSGLPQSIDIAATVMIVFARNVAIAAAISALAFADAASSVLLARRIEAARFGDEIALAEARELEAHFHPHFLFNALTSIAALIRCDPDKAAAMSRRLSDLFERIVVTAGIQQWPLSGELDLADDYMAVQRMRFGDRMRIEEWDVPAALSGVKVPRLLLQPLLENALKHAVSQRHEATSIGLKITKRRSSLVIRVWNDLPDGPIRIAEGRGLAFVRKSVAMMDGQFHVETNDRFVVTCSIPRSR
jgi:two-component system sensor histidine kinase AlgZ